METHAKKHPSVSFILLGLLVIYHTISNITWLQLNNTPPPWDEAAHTRGAIEYTYFFSQLLRGHLNLDLLRIPFIDPYFPMGKLIASFLLFLTYPDVKIAQFVGTIFFIGSILLMYKITHKVTGSNWGALLSSTLISFAPHVLDRSHIFSLDIGVLFFYLLAVYFFILSDNLKSKRYSFLFFIAFACTMLTKFQAFMYYIPMFMYEAYYMLKSKSYKDILINSLLGVFGASLLTIPVILANFEGLRSYLSIATQSQFAAPKNLLSIDTWLYYLQQLPNGFFPLIYAPILLIGIVFFLRSNSKYKALLLFQSIGIYILLTLIANKGVRFYFPILPSIIIMSVIGLIHLTRSFNITRIMILLYIVVWGTLMNATLSFSLLPSIKPIFYDNYNVVKSYNPNSYPFNALIGDILANSGANKGEQTILFIPNFEEYNLNSMNMYLRSGNINNITATALPTNVLFQHYFQNKPIDIDASLQNYTFYVYSDTEYGDPWFIDLQNKNEDVQVLLQERIKQEIVNNTMAIVSTYKLPTGETIHLVRKTPKTNGN